MCTTLGSPLVNLRNKCIRNHLCTSYIHDITLLVHSLHPKWWLLHLKCVQIILQAHKLKKRKKKKTLWNKLLTHFKIQEKVCKPVLSKIVKKQTLRHFTCFFWQMLLLATENSEISLNQKRLYIHNFCNEFNLCV